jgi:Protein of unknown function (DUF2877)
VTAAHVRSVGAAAVKARGEAILARLGIDPVGGPEALALAIVPAEAVPFRADLQAGLESLLDAVALRRHELAAASAALLVGLGPGRTPLGDDYLAGCGLAVARFGGPAGFGSPDRERWLASLLPKRMLDATSATSARMIARALHGIAEPQITGLLRLRRDEAGVARAVTRVSSIGATSGRAWAASIGASAMLLAAGPDDHD